MLFFISFLSFFLDKKESKNQVKNMLYAPLGKLRFLRFDNPPLKSCFLDSPSLLAFLTGLRACSDELLINYW
jgi:hypothetical protein